MHSKGGFLPNQPAGAGESPFPRVHRRKADWAGWRALPMVDILAAGNQEASSVLAQCGGTDCAVCSAGMAGLSGASFRHSPAIVMGGKSPRALSFYVKQATRKTAEQARPHLIEYRAWFSDFVGRNTPT